jgi:transposase InsO family protein
MAAGSGSQVRLVEHKVLVHLSEEEKNRDTTSWVLDTGATNHMSGARMAFAELDTAVRGSVSFGDGSVANIEGCGTVLFNCKNGEHRSFVGVYYIPRLTSNIISIGQLDEAGYKINIDDGVLRIREQSRRLLARVARRADRLYVLDLDIARPVCLAARGKEEAWRWHARMGHVNMNALRKLAREEMVRGLPPIEQVDQLCDACLAGKQRRNSFPAVAQYRAERTLEIVHGDLCGPITPATPSGGRYFLLLVDDKSRFMWLSVMSTKDQAAAAIKAFQERTEAESGLKLGVLRTDRGGEFTSVEFAEYCAAEGVRRQLTAPYSPQQNGVVERRNGTVVATARSMLKAKGLPG